MNNSKLSSILAGLGHVLAGAAPALEVALQKGLIGMDSKAAGWAAVGLVLLSGIASSVTSAAPASTAVTK